MRSLTAIAFAHIAGAYIAGACIAGACIASGCQCQASDSGPPVPASSDPEGKDLVEGAIVAAYEKNGGVRLYKITEVVYFPPPIGDELVMQALNETGNDFKHAAALWHQRKFTVAVPNARVRRSELIKRDHRVLAVEPVTDADKKLKPGDKLPSP